jgi:phosphocarrier protein
VSGPDRPDDPPATKPQAAGPDGADPDGADPDGAGADPVGDPPAAMVLTARVIVPNRRGLHARAAAKLVTIAERFGAAVDVAYNGQSVSARSIMGLMMLGAGPGAALDLSAEGWDAREALDALTALIEAGFHEQD